MAISLNQNEAAIIGEHALLIKFPSYSGRYKINDAIYDTAGKNEQSVQIPINANIVKLISMGNKHIGYVDGNGIDCTEEHGILSRTIIEYKEQVSLNSVLYHKTKEDHLQFDAWVARLNEMKKTYEPIPDKEEPYVYKIIGSLVDTKNKFIQSNLAVGLDNSFRSGHFIVLNKSVIQDEMRILGEKYKLEVDSSSSSIEFFKVAKQYIFNKNSAFTPTLFMHNTTSHLSLDAATEYEQSVRKQVHISMIAKVTIASDLMVSDLVAILTKVKSDVSSLDVKVKDISAHRLIIKNISDKINQLQFQV